MAFGCFAAGPRAGDSPAPYAAHMKRSARILCLASGALLLAGALAHAFLGWPQLGQALRAASISTGTIGALAAGWYFGGACMLAFAAITFSAGLSNRGAMRPSVPLFAIAITYFLFGWVAFVLRHFNPHFLGFVVLGLIVGTAAVLSSRPQPRR